MGRGLGCLLAATLAGCQHDGVRLPAGAVPPPAPPADVQTAARLDTPRPAAPPPAVPDRMALPPSFPGADAPPPTGKGEDAPPLVPVSAALPADGRPLTLAELQAFALLHNPSIRRAQADADAAYGTVIQQGLHPNPTVGYQADQMQPNPRNFPRNAGQQGGFVNQLVKTAGKLSLAQAVAGFDYLNAVVAVRRAEVEVTAAVRGHYFQVLVAKQSVEVNAALAALADEVYRLQLKRVTAGEAAGYEPLQLHAQAVIARNAVAQAEAQYRSNWGQLAAALGRPDLPVGALAGRADAPAPDLPLDALRDRVVARHTDLLAARNTQVQAQVNLTLQQRLPIPDLQTNTYQQYDTLARGYQLGVQVGIQLPLSDRNQGNIRQAQAQIGRAAENLLTVQNDLLGRLAEAAGRYDAARTVAANFRTHVLPDLTRAYRAQVARYQIEPDKVPFTDLVVAQQLLGGQLQAYLAALAAQWQAAVDLARLGQLDDLYPAEPVTP